MPWPGRQPKFAPSHTPSPNASPCRSAPKCATVEPTRANSRRRSESQSRVLRQSTKMISHAVPGRALGPTTNAMSSALLQVDTTIEGLAARGPSASSRCRTASTVTGTSRAPWLLSWFRRTLSLFRVLPPQRWFVWASAITWSANSPFVKVSFRQSNEALAMTIPSSTGGDAAQPVKFLLAA